MSEWRIRLPFRDRADSLVEVASAAGVALDGDEGLVAREVALHARLALGMRTAGELIDHLEGADPTERRRLLDEARKAADLPATDEVERRERFERANQSARLAVGRTSPLQFCHAPGCSNYPVDQFGVHRPVDAKRWHCGAHLDQAGAGDMDPRPPLLEFSPSGGLVERDDGEEIRQAREAEKWRVERQAREAEAKAQAEEKADRDRADRERLRRETPRGVFPN